MTVHALKSGEKKLDYKMSAKGERGEIYLYDFIGSNWGIGANQFAKDLKALGAVSTIDLRINSDGGDVFEGRSMYSLLADHKARIVVHVDGLAASIASLIAMAGDEIRMADGSYMMIHKAWGIAIGNDDEMDRVSALLRSVSGTLADTYVARTKQTRAAVDKWMADETWFTAAEAKKNGFCDVVAEPVKVAASLRDLVAKNDGRKIGAVSRFKNIPAALRPNRAAAMEKIAAMRG
jgi:ATP-dependent Clp protease, protease subunit